MTRLESKVRHQSLARLIVGAAASMAVAGVVLAVSLGVAAPVGGVTSAFPSATPGVQAVSSIGITVSDLDRSVAFYTDVLGFEKVNEVESAGDATEHLSGVFGARCRTARLKLGQESIELTQYLAPEGRPIPADSRSNDRWFQHIAIVVSDMDRAYAQLRKNNVRHASSGPQTLPDWNPNAGGISAFYFKDPDGHVLEVIHFPPGKGDPRWQEPKDKLFLGVDHTAIVVADTERSIAFYKGVLGMRVAGASENYGTEQEHLNNVFGARLRITALRADQGPGVELLEYLAPTDGRPVPADLRANDLAHWHTTLVSPSIDELQARLRDGHAAWVSTGLIQGVEGSADFTAACQVRDPDGHAVVVGQTVVQRQAAQP
jgi:catechol 2,3-dioxygenase-like lactoylglutathione lyase family enzyme